jgi:predicted ATPase
MKILYVNNYRGFSKTFINLMDVNFLLGENSTGKTSILYLLNLLSSSKFWNSQDFNNDEVDLGSFSEIISQNAKEQHFEIALIDTLMSNKEGTRAFYMKFEEYEESPLLTEYRVLGKKNTYCVKQDKINVLFAEEKSSFNHTNDAFMIFRKWIERDYSDLDFTSFEKNVEKTVLSLISDKNNKIAPNLSFFRNFLNNLTWLAPIRAKPKRNYEGYKVNFSSAGEHIPYMLKSILQNGDKNNSEIIKNELEKFGISSGLFDKIQIKTLGDEKAAPFEIHIKLNELKLKLTNVGYGVSQILPIIVEILSRPNDTWFAIQQPEVHIHPKGQAALGELFFAINQQENKSFIIETHSDFIVDRYRLAVRKHNKTAKNKVENAQVLFFERTENGNVVHHLPIDEHGDYPDNQPAAFRDFFIREELEMLSY